MTVQLKVKGYINGNEWGAVDAWPSLLTYEQLVALNNQSSIDTELNTYPEEYYNKFNNEWHIINYTMYQNTYLLSNNWSRTVVDGCFYYYSTNSKTWGCNTEWGPE